MKVKALTDIKIVCDPPNFRWYGSLENQAKAMEDWATEFNHFMRDHRSQDRVSLHVERVYEDICSHCKRTYEEDADGPLCCNKAAEEWELQKKVPA